MKILALALGVIGVLLGGLWLLQGIGVVRIAPILCVADCAPLEGPSPTWAIIGALVLTAGLGALFYALKSRARRGERSDP